LDLTEKSIKPKRLARRLPNAQIGEQQLKQVVVTGAFGNLGFRRPSPLLRLRSRNLSSDVASIHPAEAQS
jgi:hypothetical protein